jgi:type II secretory pathway component PulF
MRPSIAEIWMLGSGVCALLVAALLVNLILPQFEPMFAQFDATPPAPTAFVLRFRYAFFLLPLLVPLTWWLLARRVAASPKPGARHAPALAALILAIGLSVLIVPLALIAMYLPIFRLADAVGG